MTDDWPEIRHVIAYGEARAVVDAQNATMSDIDDKAMRTVRLIAVLLGLLATGVQFAPAAFDDLGLRLSFALFVLSTMCGVVTYNESNLYVGPRGAYIEDMSATEFFDPPWQEHFLETMAGMIAQNEDEIRRNARWLTATQVTLVAGVTAAVGAVAI